MQLHIPQDYGTVAEVQNLMAVNRMIVSPQASKPIMGVIQDCQIGSWLMTLKDVAVPYNWFVNCIYSAGIKYVKKLTSLLTRAKEFYGKNVFNGKVLFSVLFPEDFIYKRKNNATVDEPFVEIKNGVLIKGVMDKDIIGRSYGSIIHKLYKDYGFDVAAEFLTTIQFLVNRWLSFNGFSVGVCDFIISEKNEKAIGVAINKAYMEVQTIINSDDPEFVKEFKINNTLNGCGQSAVIDGLSKNNRLEVMIKSGSKGSKTNILQITGNLGQNNVEGKRIQSEIDDGQRTLPCFKKNDKHPKCFGFIENSFLKGLTPAEFFMHAKAGREGVINTAIKTRDSGYAESRLVKRMEDIIVNHDGTIRNSSKNIIDFSYGDNYDPVLVYKSGVSFVDIAALAERLNADIPKPDEKYVLGVLGNGINIFQKKSKNK